MSDERVIRVEVSAVVLAAIVILVLMCLASSASGDSNRSDRLRMADSLWGEDLDYFARELPRRHKNLFFNLPESEFYSMISELRGRIPTLSDYEIVVSLMEILAGIGDSHTLLGLGSAGVFSRLPVRMEWYSDGLYVVGTAPGLQGMLGRRVVGIGGRSIEEINRLVATVIPHDNDAQIKTDGPRYMAVPEVLSALGIADDPDSVSFDIESVGEIIVASVAFDEKIPWTSVSDSLGCDLPLHMRNPDRYYWFDYLEDTRVLYLHYGSCREMEERPFRGFADEVLDLIDSRPVEKLVFDLRHNGGGNSALAGHLISDIKARPSVNRSGHLFVVVGRKTFSSAILNALALMKGSHALVVGEETGGKPNHYGEVRFFLLPNSGVPVQYSTKYFATYPEDLPSISPDIDIQASFADLLSCRDPVLEAILEYEAGP